MDGFSLNVILDYFFENMSRKFEVYYIKSGKNNGYFTWRQIHIYYRISPNSSYNEKYFMPSFEEIKHIFYLKVIFRKCFRLWDNGPPLWSSGQSFWLQIQRSRVRFPALPDFLSSSGSGTGSTQPREVN